MEKPVKEGFWNLWQTEEVSRPTKKPRSGRICVICISEIEEHAAFVECPHCSSIMHRGCVEDWVKLRGGICPVCKRPLT